jgi:hypothetical protein
MCRDPLMADNDDFDDEEDSEIEGLKLLIDSTARIMAINDPGFRSRKAVERGDMAVPRRYRMMAIYAVKFVMSVMEEGDKSEVSGSDRTA